MKTNNQKDFFLKVFAILSLMSCISCSKIVTVKISEQVPKPVLSCLFTNNSVFKVDLSLSSSIYDEPTLLENGEVLRLFSNDVLLDSLHWNGQHYVSEIMPQTNVDYKIEWEKEEAKITSYGHLPEKVFVESATLKDSVGFDESGTAYSECTLVLNDDPQHENFYEILLMRHYIRNGENIISNYTIFSSDPVIKSEGLIDYEPMSILFSDEMINGQSHRFAINYYPSFRPDDNQYQLILHLRSVSEAYYNYAKSLTIHKFYQVSSIWNGMGSPVPMSSNIEGGYGVFAGYSLTTDTVAKAIKK